MSTVSCPLTSLQTHYLQRSCQCHDPKQNKNIYSKKLREIALFFQGKNAPNIGFKSRFHYIPDEILWRNDKNTISFNIHFSFLGPGDTHRVKIWVNQGLWQVSRLSYISCSTSRITNLNHQKMYIYSKYHPKIRWYLVTKIVLTYCEKKMFVIEKIFEIRSRRPRICQIFEITWTIHSNWNLRTISGNRMLF